MKRTAKRIIASVIVLALSGCAKQEPVNIQFRFVETEPSDDLTEVVCTASGEKFYLHDEVLITNTDIAQAHLGTWNDRPAVDLIFTEDGRKIFAQLTEENVGRRVGMLLDGELVTAPIINAPILEGRAIINGDFTEEEAKRIAAGIMEQLGKEER